MQNMGIEVLFKGINSLRLWQGLWVDVYKRQVLLFFMVEVFRMLLQQDLGLF